MAAARQRHPAAVQDAARTARDTAAAALTVQEKEVQRLRAALAVQEQLLERLRADAEVAQNSFESVHD